MSFRYIFRIISPSKSIHRDTKTGCLFEKKNSLTRVNAFQKLKEKIDNSRENTS